MIPLPLGFLFLALLFATPSQAEGLAEQPSFGALTRSSTAAVDPDRAALLKRIEELEQENRELRFLLGPAFLPGELAQRFPGLKITLPDSQLASRFGLARGIYLRGLEKLQQRWKGKHAQVELGSIDGCMDWGLLGPALQVRIRHKVTYDSYGSRLSRSDSVSVKSSAEELAAFCKDR
jgi:hypothetical protein